jgi:hypothetical protein
MNVITLEEMSERIEKRKIELGLTGNDYVTKNSGISRTESKRALLQSIYDQCKLEGREPPFEANF